MPLQLLQLWTCHSFPFSSMGEEEGCGVSPWWKSTIHPNYNMDLKYDIHIPSLWIGIICGPVLLIWTFISGDLKRTVHFPYLLSPGFLVHPDHYWTRLFNFIFVHALEAWAFEIFFIVFFFCVWSLPCIIILLAH